MWINPVQKRLLQRLTTGKEQFGTAIKVKQKKRLCRTTHPSGFDLIWVLVCDDVCVHTYWHLLLTCSLLKKKSPYNTSIYVPNKNRNLNVICHLSSNNNNYKRKKKKRKPFINWQYSIELVIQMAPKDSASIDVGYPIMGIKFSTTRLFLLLVVEEKETMGFLIRSPQSNPASRLKIPIENCNGLEKSPCLQTKIRHNV